VESRQTPKRLNSKESVGSAGNDAVQTLKNIYDAMGEVRARYHELMVDNWDLFNKAYSVPNPSLPPKVGTWVGTWRSLKGGKIN
jgi:hypothetical protein